MSLDRQLGFRGAVPDPSALAAFYGELGLTGDAGCGYRGSGGGAAVVVDQAPFRRLISVEVGCHDEHDLDMVQQRLEAGGASTVRDSQSVSVTDVVSRVRIAVNVAPPEGPFAPVEAVAANAPGAVVRSKRTGPSRVRCAASAASARPSRSRHTRSESDT